MYKCWAFNFDKEKLALACGRTVKNCFVYRLNHPESRLQPNVRIRRLFDRHHIPVKLGFSTNYPPPSQIFAWGIFRGNCGVPGHSVNACANTDLISDISVTLYETTC